MGQKKLVKTTKHSKPPENRRKSTQKQHGKLGIFQIQVNQPKPKAQLWHLPFSSIAAADDDCSYDENENAENKTENKDKNTEKSIY